MSSPSWNRRNARAEALGFRNYYEYRKAYETGKVQPVRPDRIKSERTRKAQLQFKPPPIGQFFSNAITQAQQLLDDISNLGYDAVSYPANTYDLIANYYDKTTSIEDKCADWSDLRARTDMAEYHPENAASLGVTRERYTEVYYNAFVDKEHGYYASRYEGGTDWLEEWFCDINDYFDDEDYKIRYPAK